MTECRACPFRLWPVRCHVAATNHRRHCELVAARRDEFVRFVEAKTLGFASKPPMARPPIAGIDVRLVVAIETCDFRRSTCGCLDKPATCLQAAYPAVVTIGDCRACLGIELPKPIT